MQARYCSVRPFTARTFECNVAESKSCDGKAPEISVGGKAQESSVGGKAQEIAVGGKTNAQEARLLSAAGHLFDLNHGNASL